MDAAPIALFAYKRPLHTKQTLDALRKNNLAQESKLFVFIDGLNAQSNEEAIRQHQEVIEICNNISGFSSVQVQVSPVNKGLAASITQGVTQLLNEYKRIIVLEDDLISSPLFLEFMNAALQKYENNSEVACISGYVYPITEQLPHAFFLKGADCWGWATWEKKWKENYRDDAEKVWTEIKQASDKSDFDFNASYPYTAMLKDRVEGKNQSWAVLWYAGAFLNRRLCLYPPKSFIHNSGNDGSGTHSLDATTMFQSPLETTAIPAFPEILVEDKKARKAFETFFRALTGSKKVNVVTRIKQKLKKLFTA